MLRTFVRLTPCFSIPIFGNRHVNDVDLLNTKLPEEPTTGWQRVKRMYSSSEIDGHSLELHNVGHSIMCGTFFGGCIGGFVKSLNAYIYFLETNQATIFTSTAQAKKKLQEVVMMAFMRGVVQWGWRVGIFTAMFSITATTVSVYRGDTSIVEYIMAGAITGAIYKANLGLIASFVGAGLGATIGAIGGLAIVGVLKITGVTMQEVREALTKLSLARKNQLDQAIDKSSETKSDVIVQHHERMIREKGQQTLDDVIVTPAAV